MKKGMIKRWIGIALVVALAGSLAACGSSSSGTESTGSGETEDASADAQQDTGNSQITFEGQTVIDNDNCAITITDISAKSSGDYTVDMNLENKSPDVTYMFAVEDAYVNGVANDPFFAKEVAPGKQSNSSLSFSSMKDYGLSEFSDIEILFHVYDSNDWAAEDVVRETIHLYPYGEEAATTYTRESQDTDIVLVDNDQVSVTVIGFDRDSIWGYEMNLFLVNKTGTTAMFAIEDCSVNGFMADPFYATSVAAGKCKFSSVQWSDSTLEENGIEDVTNIEFTLHAYDYDNFETADYANQTCTVNP